MTEHNPKILTVDDKPQNLYAMDKILRKLDVEIVHAASGEEALALTLEHDFCLAIVDVQMPGMDGYELVELLRGNEATESLPVIFVSAIFSDEYHHRKGYDAGAVDFMSKPFAPEILLSKVKVFLDLYNQRARLQELVQELDKANLQVVCFNEELEGMVRQRTAELETAYRQLELLDRHKSDFIEVVSHELRTPLTLIKGNGQILLADAQVRQDEMQLQLVRGIVAGMMRMHDIINSMLDVSRIDSNTLNLVVERLSLAACLEELRLRFASTLVERRLGLVLENLNSLPEIEADPDLLSKMFEHLLTNAVKYTPDCGTITVSGRLLENEDPGPAFVEVVVSDTGIGIDPQFHELIFAKFYQTGEVAYHSSSKTRFKGGGPGLGLAIVRGIVLAHGGRVWVESLGHDEQNYPGSTFHVVLPLEQKRPAALDPEQLLAASN